MLRELSRERAPERPTSSRHGPLAQLLIAWSPLSLILVTYGVAQWISAPLGQGDDAATNRLGFALHVTGPARVDAAVFGEVPSVWLQARLADPTPHWYDAVAALVYVTHLVTIPIVTAVVWFRFRELFPRWVVAVLALTTLGVAGYVVYPAAPPWLAAQRDAIGSVDRTSSLGWDYLHLGFVQRLTDLGQGGSNPVAAMPSLHAGVAVLIALVLWPVATRAGRVALVAYALAMALTLVYTGEHYVVDVVVGWLVAVVAVALARAVTPAAGRRPVRGGPRAPYAGRRTPSR